VGLQATNANGLVAAYGFNEGTGAVVADASGLGNTASFSGDSSPAWTTGIFGSALLFDGTNDLVTVANADSLNLTNGMTIEAWIKPTALNNFSTVVMKEQTGELAYSLYAADGATNPPSIYISQSGRDKNT